MHFKTMLFCGKQCSENTYVEIHITFCFCHNLLRREWNLFGQRVLETKVSGVTLVGRRTLLRYETGFSATLRQTALWRQRPCRHCNNSVAWPWLQNSRSNIDTCGLFQRKKEFTMSEAEEYEVETIVSKRLRKGKLILRVVPYIMRLLSGKAEYLVKWKGWEDPDDNTWEPIGNLECHVSSLLRQQLHLFHHCL